MARRRIVAVGASLVLALSVVLIYWHFSGGAPQRTEVGQAYFIDLASGELIATDAGKLPPFATVSGGTAVRAFVYACGSCDESASRRIGYVQKHTDEALRLLAAGQETLMPAQLQVVDAGTVIAAWRDGEVGSWMPINSPTGAALRGAWRTACADVAPQVCAP